MRRIAVTLFISFISSVSFAEYRVYELAITNNETGETRTVISTLDDIQYPGYFPLRGNESITLVDTWMCWGRHGEFKKPCPNPRAEQATVPSTSSAAEQPPVQP